MPSILFKEFLPDQPELGNPGLIVAKNVIPTNDGWYAPMKTLTTDQGTMTTGAVSIVATFVSGGASKFDSDVYAYAGLTFYRNTGGGNFTAIGSNTVGSSVENFAQYEDLVIAVGDRHFPFKHTINSSSNFSTLAASATAPVASYVGIIGQTVVLGNLGEQGVTADSFPSRLQWSGVDAPTSWPVPNSATAIAQQAGAQDMPSRYGQVTGIFGGDQHGVIFQSGAVSRMTYVGPPVVFQFDTIETKQGNIFARGAIQVGRVVYFISKNGFFKTDGVSVVPIGDGKVDKFFWESPTQANVWTGFDPQNNVVNWAWSSSAGSASTCNRMLSLNVTTEKWAYSDVALEALVTPGSGMFGTNFAGATAMAFNAGTSSYVLGKFSGTAGSAIFETGEFEANEGGRAYLDAVKPHVESSGTAPSLGVRIGTRNDLGTAPSYTATAGPNSRSGFAHFRSDAKYHRVELNITGNFDRATGLEVAVEPSGSV